MTGGLPLGPTRPAALCVVLLAAGALGSCGSRQAGGTGPGAAPPPSGVIGHWQGRLHQRGLAPFTVRALVRSLRDSGANRVWYSGIRCAGNWTYFGRRGRAFRFREVIRVGHGGKCKGVGTVTLVPAPGGRLGYRFQGGGVVSRGVLSRVPGG
ncbi:MAG TPA: hypothetical protein VKA96_03170 [Solirubrobacteraceae bacterium]|nr:hypothetical protein [Solirubrobacteraceae bacterium]